MKGWTLTLDTFEKGGDEYSSGTTYTRLRVLYRTRDRFRFRISPPGPFGGLGRRLGLQDVEVGHRDFDRDHVVKASDAGQVKALLGNDRIRALIRTQGEGIHRKRTDLRFYNFQFRSRRLSRGTNELRLIADHVVTDLGRLRSMFELFEETLNQLVRIGSAQPTGVVAPPRR